jgi:hypothetical protein
MSMVGERLEMKFQQLIDATRHRPRPR